MQENKASNSVLTHLRANLWLLFLTVVICCVLYPFAVWVVGQLLFHDQAEGSLVYQKDADGKDVAVGSNLIAQPFNSSYFFQSRPSATSPGYNAAASGGSNYAASNPKLRGRVASLLGTISRYSDAYKTAHGGDPTPQGDLLAWYKEQPPEGRWFDWANNNPTLVQQWATGTTSIQDYISWWEDKHPGVAEDWKKDNATATQPPGFNDLLPYFFRSYEKAFAGNWPSSESVSAWANEKDQSGMPTHSGILTRWKAANPDKGDGSDDDLTAFFPDDSAKNPNDWPNASAGGWVDVAQKAVVQPAAFQDSDIQGTFFDTWYTEQVKAGARKPEDFRQVPADLVTTSGSGLDPDISLANAIYQKETVVPAYADKIAKDYVARDENKNLTDQEKQKLHDDLTAKLTPEIGKVVTEQWLKEQASSPMFGLTGDKPLINVLQLNRRLQKEMAKIDPAKFKTP